MAALPNEFNFLTEPSLDPEIKKILLAGLLEDKRHARDNDLKAKEAQASQALEQKKFWHNTPLMLALVGTISVFANGLVAYVQAVRTTSDTITLKELEAKLKESEDRSKADRERQLSALKQQLNQEASEADAKRGATKEEREFAFKIIERELGKTGDSQSRAEILLFLVRAGIVNSLNRTELEKMALVEIQRTGGNAQQVGIPATLGRVLNFVAPDSIDFQKVLSISDARTDADEAYSFVHMSGGNVNVRQPAESIVRLANESLFTKLSARTGRQLWVKSAAAIRVQRIDFLGSELPDVVKPIAWTELTLESGTKFEVNPADALAIVNSLHVTPPLAQLTNSRGSPIWVKGSAVTSVIDSANTGIRGRAVLVFANEMRQGVNEDVPTARTILNAHGGKISSSSTP
jgi:hypothetical protein